METIFSIFSVITCFIMGFLFGSTAFLLTFLFLAFIQWFDKRKRRKELERMELILTIKNLKG